MGQPPTTKPHLSQNVDSAEVEKYCPQYLYPKRTGPGFKLWPFTMEFFINNHAAVDVLHTLFLWIFFSVSRNILFFLSLLLSISVSGEEVLWNLCGKSYSIYCLITQFQSPLTMVFIYLFYFESPYYFMRSCQLNKSLVTDHHVFNMCLISGNLAQCLTQCG